MFATKSAIILAVLATLGAEVVGKHISPLQTSNITDAIH